MSYEYQIERPKLFTEEGVAMLFKVRDQVSKHIFHAGACTADKIIRPITGDSWLMLAAIDYMEELGEIKCVYEGYRSNDAVYIKGGTK